MRPAISSLMIRPRPFNGAGLKSQNKSMNMKTIIVIIQVKKKWWVASKSEEEIDGFVKMEWNADEDEKNWGEREREKSMGVGSDVKC